MSKELKDDFKSMVQEHELLAYKVCRIYGHSKQDREDLFQEIMVQLWKAFPSFNRKAKFTTWMYRVALYTAIAGIRKKNIVLGNTEIENLEEIASEGEDKYQQEQLNNLYKAIEKLNEIDKAIVMLYLDDKSYEEMEEIMGINQGNLRVKMNRIKDKLRKLTNN